MLLGSRTAGFLAGGQVLVKLRFTDTLLLLTRAGSTLDSVAPIGGSDAVESSSGVRQFQ